MSRIHDSFTRRAPGAVYRLPDTIDDAGLLVGWSLERMHRKQPPGIGFGSPDQSAATGHLDPVLLQDEGHLITFAPTGQGKGRSCIVPALLRHEGPVIAIDPKGENVAVTARRRRELGQQVVILDPIGITGGVTGCFNPLDLIDGEGADGVDIASMFAAALIDGRDDPRNTYWYQRGQQLLIGLMLHIAATRPAGERNFEALRSLLARLVGEGGDPSGTPGSATAELLASPHPEARFAASVLKIGVDQGLGSILSMAQDGVDFLRGPQIGESLSRTDFDLDAVTRGDPLSIFLVLPPHMMESHGRLLRLWVMALLSLITRRRARPARSTLFLLDEAAQLGPLAQLRQAVTLLRGYGVQTWSLWQDVSQLRHLYPNDWETMLNNCRVVQCFGALNLQAARAMSGLTGFGTPEMVLDLGADEMLLQVAGDEAVVARKPDYLTDPAFRGQYDDNPYHAAGGEIVPPPAARIKLFERNADGPPARPLATFSIDPDEFVLPRSDHAGNAPSPVAVPPGPDPHVRPPLADDPFLDDLLERLP